MRGRLFRRFGWVGKRADGGPPAGLTNATAQWRSVWFQPVAGEFTAIDSESMRSKLHWASAIAVAATLTTALITTQGSGALAQDIVLEVEPAKPSPQFASPRFVSNPVVQPLPAEAAETEPADGEAEIDAQEPAASSLHELVANRSVPASLSREMRCLAGAVYFEARGESLDGQLAVGRVIVERASSSRFPNSYCGVVFQRSQFSFVRGNRMPRIRTSSNAWRKAVAVAQIAHEGSWQSPAEGALFFHATRVSPGWRLTRVARVDNHVFYR